jgi:hypothetical protein
VYDSNNYESQKETIDEGAYINKKTWEQAPEKDPKTQEPFKLETVTKTIQVDVGGEEYLIDKAKPKNISDIDMYISTGGKIVKTKAGEGIKGFKPSRSLKNIKYNIKKDGTFVFNGEKGFDSKTAETGDFTEGTGQGIEGFVIVKTTPQIEEQLSSLINKEETQDGVNGLYTKEEAQDGVNGLYTTD